MNTKAAKYLMIVIMMARGTGFLFSHNLLIDFHPFNVLGIRFTLAFIVLAVIYLKKWKELNKNTLIGGLLLGVTYTLVMSLEMFALTKIDTGTASFTVHAAIIIVPLYELFLFHKVPNRKTLFCAVLAFLGIGCLSLCNGVSQLNLGIFFAICEAFAYAACILITSVVSQKGDPILQGTIQLGTMGILSICLSYLVTGNLVMPYKVSHVVMFLCIALICSCFGFAMQPLAQKYLDADTTAMMTAINPLTASILGIVILKENYNFIKILGYVLILSGILICLRKKA